MKLKKVPRATIYRIPWYLRGLSDFKEKGEEIISSRQLGEIIGTNAAQVRKDLSYIGEFGTRGIGYEVDKLKKVLNGFMGLKRQKKVVIAGVGRLGSALVGYEGFKAKGLKIEFAFDVDKSKIGSKVSGLEIFDVRRMKELLKNKKIDIGIISTPKNKAQMVAEQMVESGVKSILNFAPINLESIDSHPVRNVDLAVELQILSYYLYSRKKKKRK
jgi:redox-sensing transcriptional repressor